MKLIPAVTLSLGLILSATVFGSFFHAARVSKDTIQVVGNASRRFDTDIVKWRLTISRNADLYEVSTIYAMLHSDIDRITNALTSAGIDAGHISVQPMITNPVHNYQDGSINGYTLQQSLMIISQDVDVVETLALNPEVLVSEGLILQQSSLEYFYSDVDRLKRELLGQAADDAKQRAEEIAASTGVTVGAITEARAGVFQITEPYSTEVSGYGMYDTSSREKDIKVTVHATFSLR